jgi:hypothetical protein
MVEILDGPPEWAGTAYQTDEDMVADEIGLTHPRWVGTPVGPRRGRCTPTPRWRWPVTGTAIATRDPGRSGAAVTALART